MRAPARRIGHYESLQIGKDTEPSRHPSELGVLLLLRLEQVFLENRGDRIPRGVRRVADRYLGAQWTHDHHECDAQQQETSHKASSQTKGSRLTPCPERVPCA